ncbi:hypothetical protein [Ramlibacter sp. AN1133]|uniref:hypothetical protein n=1 Tax=Ramlibacter sp. AN1133 TaxID=3133429 RepID=UPI0030C09A4E
MGNGKHAPPPGGPQDKAEIEAVLDRIGRRIKELRGFDASGIRDRWDSRLELLQKNVNKTIADAVGMGSAQYRQLAIGPLDAALDSTFGDRYTLDELREEVRKAVGQAAMRLNAAAKVLERRLAGGAGESTLAPLGDTPASNFGALPSGFAPLPSGFAPLPSGFAPLAAEPPKPPPQVPAPLPAPEPPPAPAAEEPPAFATTAPSPLAEPAPVAGSPTMNPPASSQHSPRIAIVCRDDSAGEAATSFVAQLGLEPVISQQPRADASSLESLEALRQVQFALVLQADRQLEIGFLLGALGRSRICFLQGEGAQDALPGLPRQPLDEGGLWKLLLARELKKSGLDVDLNKAI